MPSPTLEKTFSDALNFLQNNPTNTKIIINSTGSDFNKFNLDNAQNLNTLNNFAGNINAITLTDKTTPTLAVTATQVVNDTKVLSLISSAYNLSVTGDASVSNLAAVLANKHVASVSVTVTDSAAHVAAALDALQTDVANKQITAINLADASTTNTPTLAITAAQFANDTAALNLITKDLIKNTTYSLTVSGVAVANLSGVNSVFANTHVQSVTVTDSAARVVAALDALQTDVANKQITAINLTDKTTPTLAVTATQVVNDVKVLSLISSAYNLSVTGDASVSNLAAVLANKHVVSVSVTVTDSAANIAAALDTLQTDVANKQITAINLADATATSTPTLAITAAQFANDTAVLNLIDQTNIKFPYNMTVRGVAVANLSTVLNTAHVKSVTVTDSAANVSAAIDALQTDVANKQITAINLTDKTTPTLAVTATQVVNDAGLWGLISSSYSLSVSDTAVNVAAALDTLQTDVAKISGITLTDATTTNTPTLAITAAQFANDTAALNLITKDVIKNTTYNLIVSGVAVASLSGTNSVFANTHVQSVSVTDSAANVAANLDTLQADAAKITAITLNNTTTPTLAITAAQFASDTAALNLITNTTYNLTVSGVAVAKLSTVLNSTHVKSVTVTDSAANIAAAIDTLQTDVAKISGITLTDATTPSLAITAAQLSNDAAVLGKITNTTYNLTVSDVTVDKLSTVLNSTHVKSVTVTDSAANIAAAIDTLQTDVAKISGITLTDATVPTLAITAVQFTNDTSALSLIDQTNINYNLIVSGLVVANLSTVLNTAHVFSVSVADSAANVAAALDTLQTDAAQISGITLTDATNTPTLAITAAQFASDTAALNLITNTTYNLTVSDVAVANLSTVLNTAHVLSVSVTDTAANIFVNLDTLQTDAAQISGITLTDAVPPKLDITAAQLLIDAPVLSLISSPYNLTVSDVTVANLSKVLANNHVLPVIVQDTAVNIFANLDTLQNDASRISGMTLTDPTTPTLSISYAQLLKDAWALSLITSPYNLTVSVAPATNLSGLLTNTHVQTVTVSDTAANVAANLDTLQVHAAQITAITLSDATLPLVITAAQFASDTAALNLITNTTYNLTVRGVAVANLSTVLNSAHVKSVTVTDSAANVAAAIDTLLADIASKQITSITLIGSTPTLAITYQKFTNDATVLGKITNTTYNLTVSGVAVANLATVLGTAHVQSVSVSDTAANVAAALKTLQTDAAQISGITLTDAGTPNLAITANQYLGDSAVLVKISTPYTLTISNETVQNSLAVGGELTNSFVASVAINDSLGNVISNIDALQSHLGKLGSITLNDVGGIPNHSIAATQYHKDTAVLGKINSSYTLHITDETAVKVAGDLTDSHITSVAVQDSAVNIVKNLNILESNIGKLSGITLTDKTAPTLTVSAAQVANDLGVLNAISSTYLLSVKDTVANIDNLNLGLVQTGKIEIMPTTLLATLTVNSHVTDLNLSQISLVGDSITEKAYQTTGTEVDIVASNGVIAHQLFFINNTESQLQLLGIGNTVVHTL